MDSLTFSTKEVFSLGTMQFVGGGRIEIEFLFKHYITKKDLDISRAKALYWTLSRMGDVGTTLLKKQCELSSNYSCVVKIDKDDTFYLEGKYIQQITLIDANDQPIIGGQGIIFINRNNDDYTISLTK